MKKIFRERIGICSAILILAGTLSLILSCTSFGISFLFQLFGVVCFVLAAFLCVSVLSATPNKYQKIARFVQILMIAMFLSLLILFLIVEYNIVQNHNGDAEIPDTVQTVLVLGCKVNGETPSLMLRYRLEATLQWLNERPNTVAILCGGQGAGEDVTEAEAMARWLVAQGIDETRLIKEESSTNARENVRNAKAMLTEDVGENLEVAVVTTGFHLFRSKKICAFEGFVPYGVASEMPNLPFFHLNYYCREFASVVKMYLQEIFA